MHKLELSRTHIPWHCMIFNHGVPLQTCANETAFMHNAVLDLGGMADQEHKL